MADPADAKTYARAAEHADQAERETRRADLLADLAPSPALLEALRRGRALNHDGVTQVLRYLALKDAGP